MRTKVFLAIISLCFSVVLHAQTDSDTILIQIQTIDGNEFIGTIINEDSEKIVLKTENLGEISIPKINIKSKKDINVQQIKNGKLWFVILFGKCRGQTYVFAFLVKIAFKQNLHQAYIFSMSA